MTTTGRGGAPARRRAPASGPGARGHGSAPDPDRGTSTVTGGRDDAAVGAVFAALADPTRRDVLRRLDARSTVTASALAEDLPMTRQAAAKHLQALAAAGLVAGRREGRETRYRAVPGALDDAATWMVRTGERWDDRLERLRRRVDGDGR